VTGWWEEEGWRTKSAGVVGAPLKENGVGIAPTPPNSHCVGFAYLR